jgi:hypothetical protein
MGSSNCETGCSTRKMDWGHVCLPCLKLPHANRPILSTATTYMHRFFSARSMAKNDARVSSSIITCMGQPPRRAPAHARVLSMSMERTHAAWDFLHVPSDACGSSAHSWLPRQRVSWPARWTTAPAA